MKQVSEPSIYFQRFRQNLFCRIFFRFWSFGGSRQRWRVFRRRIGRFYQFGQFSLFNFYGVNNPFLFCNIHFCRPCRTPGFPCHNAQSNTTYRHEYQGHYYISFHVLRFSLFKFSSAVHFEFSAFCAPLIFQFRNNPHILTSAYPYICTSAYSHICISSP